MDLPAFHTASPGYDFEAAYHEHFDYVWMTLGRMGVERTELEDGVQDVFMVAHRRQGDFDGSCALRTWLFGISRRVASDYRRRNHRHRRRVDALARLGPRGLDEDDVRRRTDATQLLHRFLSSLDDGKRAVFILTELEQMTSHEVARALRLNRNTVAARLRAARHAFERYAQRVQRPTAAQMLIAAREQPHPPPRVATRVLGLLIARVEMGSTATAGASAFGVLGWLKATAFSIGIAAAVLVTIRVGSASSEHLPIATGASARPAASARPTTSAPIPAAARGRVARSPADHSGEPLRSTPVPPERGSGAQVRPVSNAPAPLPPPQDDLQRQTQQLRSARTALQQGDAARALELTSSYERSFPEGLYRPEFALTRVRALCAQGKIAQARGEAVLLRRWFPESPVVALLDPACPESPGLIESPR